MQLTRKARPREGVPLGVRVAFLCVRVVLVCVCGLQPILMRLVPLQLLAFGRMTTSPGPPLDDAGGKIGGYLAKPNASYYCKSL